MAVEAPETYVTENTPNSQAVRGSITTSDGITVESNYETADELRKGLEDETGLKTIPVRDEKKADADSTPQPERRRNRRDDPRVAVETAVGKQRTAEAAAKAAEERAEKLAAEIEALKKPQPVASVPGSAVTGAPPHVPQPTFTQAPPQMPAQHQTPQSPQQAQQEYLRFMGMPDAPKAEQFKTIDEYQYAVNLFVADKRFEERMAQHTAQQEARQLYTDFNTKIAAKRSVNPAFAQAYDAGPVIDVRVLDYVMRRSDGADIVEHLITNPQLLQQISMLNPTPHPYPNAAQIGQIGEIAGMLKAQGAAAVSSASARPVAISQAKPVVKRTTGEPPATTDDQQPGDDASDAAHDAWAARHRPARFGSRRR